MEINFDKEELVPAIIQDVNSRKVLMLGYMNQESYKKTIETKKVTFYSRSRKRLWTKGEESGNFLELVSIKLDCDQDTFLVEVRSLGPVCHKGTDTCWAEKNEEPLMFLNYLQAFLNQRFKNMPDNSYTTELFKSGINRMAQKVGEEAVETIIEATNGKTDRFLYEGSDLIYHLMVLLTAKGYGIEDLAKELQARHKDSWKKH